MNKTNQSGSVGLLILLGVFVVLFVSATGFSVWAFMSRQDYKDNSDQKAAIAVAAAIKQEDKKKDAEFAEAEKSPLKTYTGPETYGKLTIKYPKTWGAYVSEVPANSAVVDGYFHPNFVPGLQSKTNFALRVQILQSSYDQTLKQYESGVRGSLIRVSPYKAPKVSGITGARVEGQLGDKKEGTVILLPLRDKTIKIWTESDQFIGDFNNTILPNLTFIP